MAGKQYDESSFRVLKGLEPVRERPGMYTRTDSPAHIIQEVIDNAADEALAGFARQISVTLHVDGSVTVADDGRGIPVGLHPDEGVPVVVLAFTRLHAGGKFDKREGNSAYAFSGGLHGVGVAVTNALSLRVDVEIQREGKHYRIEFTEGGERISQLSELGTCGRKSGTRVRVWPDTKYFDSPKVPMAELERLLRSKAVLLPGVAVRLDIEQADGSIATRTWSYPEGLAGYLREVAGDVEPVAPIYTFERYADANDPSFANGEGAAWAIAWFEQAVPSESYVNLIPTVAGGTHESGLRAGVFDAVKSFIEHHALLPRGVKLQQDDVCGRMSFVLSARLLDPQFQGQVKEKLNSREAVKLVSGQIRDPFEIWLNNHVEAGKAIAELSIKQAMARQRSAQKVEKRKTSGVAVLPGKLSDCESEDISENEIFLVEGDSAGGSAKMARNKENQAILPLRGKVLNVQRAQLSKVLENSELQALVKALGTGIGEAYDPEKLRYGRIILMADADVDGGHITTLLLTFFHRFMPELIAAGRLYLAQPPLFQLRKGSDVAYAMSDAEREQLMRTTFKGRANVEVQRFKGLGEMDAEQLWRTTMDPERRTLLRVGIEDAERTAELFNLLMGNQTDPRREWIVERAQFARNVDI